MKHKAVKYFACFLLLMLVCTIVSRGIYTLQMPKITTGYAARKNIEYTVEAEGSLNTGTEKPVTVSPGLMIQEICVKEGQKVDGETVLMKLDMAELEETIKALEREVVIEEAKLQDMRQNEKIKKDAKQKNTARAEEDLLAAGASKDTSAAAAQKAYDELNAELSAYTSLDAYVAQKKKEDEKYQELKGAAQQITFISDKDMGEKGREDTKEEGGEEDNNKEELENARKAFQEYEASLEAEAKNEWETKKQSLEAEAAEKAEALRIAQETGEEKLQSAKRTLEDAGALEEQNTASVLEQENNLQIKRDLIKTYQGLQQEGGAIKGTIQGYVKKVNALVGAKTTEEAAFTVAEDTGDFTFLATIGKDQKTYVNVGDKAEITFKEGRATLSDMYIEGVKQSEEDNYEVSITIPSEGRTLGEIGNMKITVESDSYDCCVPLSSLFAENNQTYVLIVQEKETILGTELSLRRMDVEIEKKNREYAALLGNPLTKDDVIVTAADKEVLPGEAVQMSEE